MKLGGVFLWFVGSENSNADEGWLKEINEI